MGVWDSDEDANPPTDNSMEESREWPLNTFMGISNMILNEYFIKIMKHIFKIIE